MDFISKLIKGLFLRVDDVSSIKMRVTPSTELPALAYLSHDFEFIDNSSTIEGTLEIQYIYEYEDDTQFFSGLDKVKEIVRAIHNRENEIKEILQKEGITLKLSYIRAENPRQDLFFEEQGEKTYSVNNIRFKFMGSEY